MAGDRAHEEHVSEVAERLAIEELPESGGDL
jgi:hypothetical protein